MQIHEQTPGSAHQTNCDSLTHSNTSYDDYSHSLSLLTHSHAIFDQYSAVLLPACFAEGVLTGQCQQRVSPDDL